MNAKREANWLIVFPDGSCMLHPRGGRTRDLDTAYGYYYKSDAIEMAREIAACRGDCAEILRRRTVRGVR